MKKTILSFFFLVALSVAADTKELQLFNPEILGQPTSNAINPLNNKMKDEIEPYIVKLDVKDGRYIASTIIYPPETSFEEARKVLNQYYGKYEHVYKMSEMVNWRVVDKQFLVSLTKEDDVVQMIYIKFQPTEEIFKYMLKSKGINIDSKDCQSK
jgi:hypothetical protein